MARTTWDAFHRQGPFVGSGGLYSPGPATAPPLSRRYERWMTLSRHPGPSPVLHRYFTAQPDSRRLFARCGRRRFTADGRSALGPRSLSPVLFWEAGSRAYLGPNVACRLLQLHYDVRALARALNSSQGRRPQPPSFSDVPRCFLAEAVSTRRAALRPPNGTPVPVPPACAGLPDRDVPPSAPPGRLAPAPCSGDRRARVSGPSEGRVPDREVHGCPSMGACAFYAHADGVPLLGAQRTPAVAGATEERGGDPFPRIGPA
jgi:hypothetical protein